MRVRAGDTGIAMQSKNHETLPQEGFTETSFSARELAEFLGIASLGFNWRNVLTVLFAVLALIICLPLLLIALFRHAKTKRYSFLTWILLCLLGIAAVETEAAFWFFADQAWVRLVWKAVVALCLLSLFLILHGKEGNLMKSFFPSVLLAVLADVVISVHFISGVALFLLCHAVLSYQFLRKAPMSLGKWIQWAVVSLAMAVLIILFYVPAHGAIGWGVAVYAPVLLLMAFSSGKQPIRVRVSAIMFLTSDLLLGLYGTLLKDPMIHVVYMFLFYLALLLLTFSHARSSGAALSRTE